MIRALLAALVVLSAAGVSFYFGADYFEEKSPTEVASPLPDTMANVLAPADVLSPQEMAAARPWQAPSYANQKGALGWTDDAFAVPTSMRARVNFWKDIYAKYSTDEGVLHDPVTLEVYESVRFKPFHQGDSLSAMAHERSRIVDAHRSVITERLLNLQLRLDNERAGALTTPFDVQPPPLSALNFVSKLSGDDARLWKMYSADPDPKKFSRAASRIRFQLGQRDKVLSGIYYSGRYLDSMETIFREEGLPIELTRLPFVESSFNTRARSKVGASGIWQFMRRTARPYMKINQNVDERNDPLVATRAAAKMMKSNFALLGNWPLAVTAWNHGPSGVRNITQKLRTDDLGRIVSTYSSRTFGFASQNFYACFLAILEVEEEALTYFAKPVWQAPLEFDEIKTPGHLTNWPTVVKLFSGNESLAADYNPQFNVYARSSKNRIGAGTHLRVPKGVTWALAEPPQVHSASKHAVRTKVTPAAVEAATPTPSSAPAPFTVSATPASAVTPAPSTTAAPPVPDEVPADSALTPSEDKSETSPTED